MLSHKLLPGAVSELFLQTATTQKLTVADRYGMLAAICEEEAISEDELRALDRILYSLRKGQIQVVDELSAIL